jgi:hypothetical protein
MRRSIRHIGNIFLWSGISNLVLAGFFLIGWSVQNIGKAVHRESPGAARLSHLRDMPQPVSGSRLQGKQDRQYPNGPQRQLKDSLSMTVVPRSDMLSGFMGEEPEASEAGPVAEPSFYVEGSEAGGPQAMNPVLLRNARTGQLEIGSFETVSLDGGTDQCLALAETMLDDAGAPSSTLQVLSDSKLITIARICTSNGAIILTCRGGQVTVSPRKLKPNERC